jgi:hypothetical protein
VDESVAMDEAEVKLKNSIAPKLTKAPPAPKVARYLQIENKIRALFKYDPAATGRCAEAVTRIVPVERPRI